MHPKHAIANTCSLDIVTRLSLHGTASDCNNDHHNRRYLHHLSLSPLTPFFTSLHAVVVRGQHNGIKKAHFFHVKLVSCSKPLPSINDQRDEHEPNPKTIIQKPGKRKITAARIGSKQRNERFFKADCITNNNSSGRPITSS